MPSIRNLNACTELAVYKTVRLRGGGFEAFGCRAHRRRVAYVAGAASCGGMFRATEALQCGTVIDHRPFERIMDAHHRGWLPDMEPPTGEIGRRTWVHRLRSAHDYRYDVLAEHYPSALDQVDLALALAESLVDPGEREADLEARVLAAMAAAETAYRRAVMPMTTPDEPWKHP
ncbi:hypothetical protein ACFWP2_28870 [Kitasatospora sp. NPDC058444]|uniref:hypothetical protein n=1 Tax=Kitasatospora sp. NPDC058444 TaxID=3346504 RepID=UPI003647A56A